MGVVMIVELATALVSIALKSRSGSTDGKRKDKRNYGCPNFAMPGNEDLPMEGTTTSGIYYTREPWGSKARRTAAYSNVLILLGVVACGLTVHEPLETAIRSVSATAWPLAFLCLLGLLFASLRFSLSNTINSLLLSRCAAIPARDTHGTHFLMYLGDVPSPEWLYHAKPRVLAFFGATALTALAGFLGAYLFDNLLPTNPAETFLLIVGARLLLTQLTARALLGDFGEFPPIPS